MHSSAHRALRILRFVPKYPRKISTPEIWQKVTDDGHEITLRSIQRALIDLSIEFGLSSEQEGRTQYWFWPKDFGRLDIPGLTPEQALIFHLAKAYLEPALPKTYINELGSFFERADTILSTDSTKASLWKKRVRVIQRGPSLSVPVIKADIAQVLHESLLSGKRALLQYKKRGEDKAREYEVSIHGIVAKDGLVYGVVTFWEYNELHQIVFHRVTQAKLLDSAANSLKGFDIDEYLKNDQAFAYPVEKAHINLQMKVAPQIAFHLEERPLSANQTQKKLAADWVEINAKVPNTEELRWWLLGFGDGIEVIGPKSLREQMKETSAHMHKQYSKK